jgi:hypothetical protein
MVELSYDEFIDETEVCVSCGTYYIMSNYLVKVWRKYHNTDNNKVMPQLCNKCMKQDDSATTQ